MLADITNYFIHLVAGLLFVSLFALVYTRTTPYDELALIRQGCTAAAISFGGALLGFVLLNFPLFGLATGTLFGIPAAYAYLFGVWLSLIIAAAFITEGRSK